MDLRQKQNEASIEWGCRKLLSLRYTLKSDQPEIVKDTPWSYVVRFITSEGHIYLKHTPKLIALEATIIKILREQFHASVPIVIAHNTELNCFLMKDVGQPLREILKTQFDAALLCKAIDQFISIQFAVADHVNVFLDIGLPDWRLDKLPGLYKQLLSQKDLLVADGLETKEINELNVLLPTVSHLCKKLAGYSVKQTIVQPDFNDNNILINNISKNFTIIDLGEIAISHPFFSHLNCLQQIKKHHGLTDEDNVYLQIMKACFKNSLDAFETAHTLWHVYGALAGYRLMVACGVDRLMSYQQGTISKLLKEFMVACVS